MNALPPAAVLLLSLSLLSADEQPLTPLIESATGLAGQQTKLTWSPQSNLRYRVEKSTSLSADGEGAWSTRALVEGGEWLDPEPPGPRAFYRVPAPQPEVFSVSPTVLGPQGTMLTIEGQCLPAGSSLVFEIEGAPPVVLPLQPGAPGTYRAALPAGAVVPGANILSATIRGPDEVILLDIKENFAVTETGRATDVPPVLPPALEWVETVWMKQCVEKDTSVRLWERDTGDGDAPSLGFTPADAMSMSFELFFDTYESGNEFTPATSLLMPALMKAKEKANRTKCGNNLRQIGLKKEEGGRHTPFHNKYRPQFYARSMPGEVVLEQDDLWLDTPAGPPIVWTRIYRSMGGGGGGGGWTSCYDIRIEPIPLAAGANAKRLYLYGGDGRRDILYRQADGSYTCTGMFREGRFNPDTSFTLTFADKSQFIFCRLVGAPWSGRIGRIEDRNGVGLDFTYNASSQLHTVTSQFGQSLTCAYGPTGQLNSITDHTSRSVNFLYYSQGEPGGTFGDLRSVSCPQLQGQPPLAGPTTFTYTTGFADNRLNHNVLTARDGAARLLAAYTYSSTTDPLAVDFDTCTTENMHGTFASSVEFATIKMEVGAAGYKMLKNDEVGRVTECDFDVTHRCVAVREYTGFAKPGMEVTSTTNRPDPAKKRRPGDPGFYQTTYRYNADSCVTRITHPDGTQERFTYGRDLRKDCPVRERGNAHLITLRTQGGEERTVTCDYLPGFGTGEGSALPAGKWKTFRGGGLVLHESAGVTRAGNRIGGDSVWDGGEDGGGQRKILDYGEAGDSVTQSKGGKAKAWMVNNYEVHPVFGLKTEWINSIGLPKVTPKISKESHGKRGSPGGLTGRPVGQPAAAGLGTHVQRLITSHGQVFTWGYDTHGNCKSSRTPVAGSGCDATYNSLGQCISCTVLNGPGSSYRTDITNDPQTSWPTGCIMDPDVNGTGAGLHITTRVERDNLGRITRCVDPRGFDWLTEYDAMDRETVSRSAGGGINGINGGMPNRISMNRYYNPGGDPVRVDIEQRDAAGALVAANPAYTGWLIYDDRGRVSRIALEQRPVDAGVVVTPVNNPPQIDASLYAVTDFTYNDAGECVQVTVPAASRGQSTDKVCLAYYDERGNEWQCQDGIAGTPGSTTVQYDYTPAGMVSRRMLLPTLPPPPPFAPNPETVWTYDGFQRVSSIADPMGNVTQYEYDEQGFTTVSVFGEKIDVPGSTGNVLLARTRIRKGMQDIKNRSSARIGHELAHVVQQRGRFRPAFFDVFVADDVWTWERFAPGAPAPHATETTTVHRSPAGLEMSCSTNGDTLYSCTYDTAGRAATCADARTIHSTVRDQAGNVILNGRTDLSTVPGTPEKIFSWTAILDEMGRCVSITDGGGNNVLCRYDSFSRLTQCTDPRGVVHRFRYDGEIPGGPGTPPVPFTCLHECDVDNDGDLEVLQYAVYYGKEELSSTDSNGYTTTCLRDSSGNLIQCNFPDGTHEVHGFDNYGRHNGIIHRDLATRNLLLDANGRVLQDAISSPVPGTVPVPPVVRTYNGLGQCMTCNQGDSHLTFTWDSLGNQLSESHNGQTVTSTFNHRGRSSVTYPDRKGWAEVRDFSCMVTSVSALNAAGVPISPPVTQVEYQGHRVARETRSDGVVTTHEYRANGDPPLPGGTEDFSYDECVRTVCTNSAGTVIHSTRVCRDRSQNVTQHDTFFTGAAQSAGRRHINADDRLNRRIATTIQRRQQTGGPFVDESVVSCTLDLEGRRLSVTGGANPGAYTQSPAIPPGDHQRGQYTTWRGGSPLEWNDDGCLTMMSSSTGTKQFVYDANSRLVAVNDPNTGAPIATYAYSADGRRTRSSIGSIDPLVPPVDTYFVYDGDTCIQELGGDGLPNVTMAAADGLHLCVISRNGSLVYPHGGGTESASGVAIPKFLDYMKKGKRSEAELNLRPFFASPGGLVTERTDCDHAGAPIFLTSDGVIRPGATGTLSGCDWFYTRRGYGVNTRSDTYLSCDRYCPETGFLQGQDGVYSPQLGQPVAKEKKSPGLGLSASRGIAVDCRL